MASESQSKTIEKPLVLTLLTPDWTTTRLGDARREKLPYPRCGRPQSPERSDPQAGVCVPPEGAIRMQSPRQPNYADPEPRLRGKLGPRSRQRALTQRHWTLPSGLYILAVIRRLVEDGPFYVLFRVTLLRSASRVRAGASSGKGARIILPFSFIFQGMLL